MHRREQVWGCLQGQPIHFCPHALGWRGAELFVLGLILHERHDPILDGPDWDWLMEWQWVPAAELRIPIARTGSWVTCPREQRPSAATFLTTVYLEAE